MVAKVPIDWDFYEDFAPEKYERWLHGIVHEILKRFSPNARFDHEELMSEAWLALCESGEKFNPEYSDSFLGYAKPHIQNRIKEFISTNMYTFKVRYYNLKKNPERLKRANYDEAMVWTDSKGAAKVDLPGDAYMSPLEAHPSGTLEPDDQVAQDEQHAIVRNAVNKELKKRERRAIVRRHREGESFREIGEALGISGESARRLYNKAIEKVETKIRQAGIRD